jgi:hypothetical protein
MLVIEIPYWVITTAVIMAACSIVCAMIAVGFDIHEGNWRSKLKYCKSWALAKYSNYQYKHHVNVTIVEGAHVSTIKELYLEIRQWLAENIENPEKTVWTESNDIVANNVTLISVEPTLFIFKFKRAEDLTHFVMRWG